MTKLDITNLTSFLIGGSAKKYNPYFFKWFIGSRAFKKVLNLRQFFFSLIQFRLFISFLNKGALKNLVIFNSKTSLRQTLRQFNFDLKTFHILNKWKKGSISNTNFFKFFLNQDILFKLPVLVLMVDCQENKQILKEISNFDMPLFLLTEGLEVPQKTKQLILFPFFVEVKNSKNLIFLLKLIRNIFIEQINSQK